MFWKGYFTYHDLEDRWNVTSVQINTAVLNEKIVPSYFLGRRQARTVAFRMDDGEHGEFFTEDETYPFSEYCGAIFVFLRKPVRTGLNKFSFHYGCEHALAPMDEVPFWSWYSFDVPIQSGNHEIVFLKSQVEKFEKTYLATVAELEPVKATLYPWGGHNTRLLMKLSDVATALWSRYDPLDPSTAPTNEQVRDWLIERKVPKRTAETMASILRADGLRMGRRKI